MLQYGKYWKYVNETNEIEGPTDDRFKIETMIQANIDSE